jgi:hypothetical protein
VRSLSPPNRLANASPRFKGSRTFAAGGATWCGRLRLRSPQVISSLRPVIASPLARTALGDEVNTLAGRVPIKWIGYNKFTKEEGRVWLDGAMPIRLARFAIDDHSPHSDFYLSPLHCIFINKALIPVGHLINGISVAQDAHSDMPAIEYYHIDLGTHEVLYAEGALVESFFDGDSEREHFSNFVEYKRLYGPERQPKMTPFAPIHGYFNRREKIKGVARSLISNVVDVRDPVQIAHAQIARRAEAVFVWQSALPPSIGHFEK